MTNTKKPAKKHSTTCQICERAILANTGKIAHHGYKRPGTGWQTGSCHGARELPWQVSCDALVRYIAWIPGHIVSMEAEITGEPEKIFCQVESDYGRTRAPRFVWVTPDTIETVANEWRGFKSLHGVRRQKYADKELPTWAEMVEARRVRLRAEIVSLREHLTYQEKRLAGWAPVAV